MPEYDISLNDNTCRIFQLRASLETGTFKRRSAQLGRMEALGEKTGEDRVMALFSSTCVIRETYQVDII